MQEAQAKHDSRAAIMPGYTAQDVWHGCGAGANYAINQLKPAFTHRSRAPISYGFDPRAMLLPSDTGLNHCMRINQTCSHLNVTKAAGVGRL